MKRNTFLTALSLLPFLRGTAASRISFFTATCKTQSDQEGPFYKKGAPFRSQLEQDGTAFTIKGKVLLASDCSTPVADAIVDIWHCDNEGNYDNSGYKCRGMVKTARDGAYTFQTIYPPPYGSRPRHIHIKVRAKGFPELTSQIYFKGDPKINNDFARNAAAARVIEVNKNEGNLTGTFDIYL